MKVSTDNAASAPPPRSASSSSTARWGRMIQTLRLSEEDFRGDALRRLAARPARQQRSPHPDAAGGDPRLPRRLSPRRRRHRRDQHLLLDLASPRPTTAWRRSPTSSTAKARGWRARPADAVDARDAGPAALRRRRHRPDQPHAPRSRPTSTIPASAPSPSTTSSPPMARRSRGLIDGGADLILIETIFDTLNAKAGDRRGRGGLRREGRPPAADDLRHDHRPLRPHALRPDADRLLVLGPPRAAVLDRPQLRARRQGDARPHRRDLAGRRHARSAPIRTPACPTSSASTTRARRPWRRCSASSPAPASSTSSAAAAARRPTTSAPSPRRSRACRRAQIPVLDAADAALRPRAFELAS